MIESLIIGAIQGIAEWLPVSSEGIILLIKANFFTSTGTLSEVIHYSLFLHFGTFLAALVYFRKKVWYLLKKLFKYKKAKEEDKKILNFLILGTLVSGVLGIIFLEIIEKFTVNISAIAQVITIIIAIMLFITAYLQLRVKNSGYKEEKDLRYFDGIMIGVVQAFAVVPGLSRSGLTVSALLMSKFNKQGALQLSFLLSLPLVLAGNIVLNLDKFNFDQNSLIALLASFIFGWLTIKYLLKLAQKINFGYFVLFFAIITLLAALII
ncbi:MAG TPA: undecaprenyl-diphosphate phosphatase [Patescibacteria group bacterium]|nr:undecaprenyl-diphosphate phosphatase [Patescibacteria group bacterium]